jgi:hypothetical protein
LTPAMGEYKEDEMAIFKAVKNFDGDDWPIAGFGSDDTGNTWTVTTDRIHASEVWQYSAGAKGDAELVARLLNEYYTNQKECKKEG